MSEITCPQRDKFIQQNDQGEKRTYYVLCFTLITMVAEIVAGTVYGSMALLADGWHMATHAAAFMITLFTYRYARKNAYSDKFSFGTGKVSVLGGYTSAIALGLVALVMLIESVERLFSPHEIHFNQAIFVACLGLTVNIISAYLLKDDHHHHHGHDHGHSHQPYGHSHHDHDHKVHQDHNLKAAYMHVLADALTSVLAIVALIAAKFWGLNWLDSLMGIVGAVIISRWSWGLIQQTSPILLDGSIEPQYAEKIRQTLQAQPEVSQVKDLHIWKVSADHYAAMISLACETYKPAEEFKRLLADFDKIDHLTIEVTVNKVTG